MSDSAPPVLPAAPPLPGWRHLSSGKVRDVYVPADDGPWTGRDVLLVVASDRISAYDHVLPTPVPDKGRVLTAMSVWWLEQLEGVVDDHLVCLDVPRQVAGRAMICRRLEMHPVECVARGYLTGSGLVEYRRSRSVCGVALPEGLTEASRLPEPIFTPAAKAAVGAHDENIAFERVVDMVGADVAAALRATTLELYSRAAAIARERWRSMRGRTGVLHSGHALVRVHDGAEAQGVSSTTVRFGSPADAEIDAYVATGEPLGCAGAFTIDGLGGAFIDGIDGDPHGVVGISLPLLRRLLAELDVTWTDLWTRT